MKALCEEKCLAGENPCLWLNFVKQGKFKEAWLEIVKYNPLPAVTGRVCPHPCEDVCKRALLDEAISINSLEGYLGELALMNGWRLPVLENKAKPCFVAVVGSGPAGLSCAYQLARRGYQVDIFETLPVLGGMLRVGIPNFRLSKGLLDEEMGNILRMGVVPHVMHPVNKKFFLQSLKYNYGAVFFATGLQKSRRLNIEGEQDNPAVLYGLDFLKSLNLGREAALGKEVMVLGGGNTAIDVARTARRLGSNVSILYRRTRSEMPAIESEIKAAEKEGIVIIEQVLPVRIGGKTVELQRTKLGEADATGRRAFVPIEGSGLRKEFDNLIIAAGEEKEEFAYMSGEKRAVIIGDAATVAGAINLGRQAAERIVGVLEKENQDYPVLPQSDDFYLTSCGRIAFDDPSLAQKEAERCLGCGFEQSGLAEITVNEERCKSCELCIEVCPCRILELADRFNSQGYRPVFAKDPKQCRGCSWCVLMCPDLALTVKKEA